MKILFLCGSLEPGRDGVGDYTRRLAGELIRQGHEAAIISLKDKVAGEIIEEKQVTGEVEIDVLRIPYHSTAKDRFGKAQKYIDAYNPDWLSLQYVPYSFHPKGLPLGLGKQLAKIGKGRKWHIMFHELWVGITRLSPWNHKIIGQMQQNIVKNLVHKLSPQRITTSNRLYQLLLETVNIQSLILPLFSNIDRSDLDLSLLPPIRDIDFNDLARYHIIGLFGTLYAEEKTIHILQTQIAKLKNETTKQIILILFGRNSNKKGVEKIKEQFRSNIVIVELNECTDNEVSNIMQILNLAISSTPQQHLGKSGVFAAFRLHNVPVITESSDPIPEYDSEIFEYNKYLFSRKPSEWSSNFTSSEYINILNN